MTAKQKTRNYAHKPYAQMDCPAPAIGVECTSLKGGVQHGSVPGIKRHVKKVHGEKVYAKLEKQGMFPAIHQGNGSAELASLNVTQLREKAQEKGIETSGLRKADLVAALS